MTTNNLDSVIGSQASFKSMPIIDTHAHLDHVPDIDNALARAVEEQVTDIVAVSTDLNAIKKNLTIKEIVQKKYGQSLRIHVAFGIHPGEIKLEELSETFSFMREHHAQAVAIGETGLDYWYQWARKNEDEKMKQRDCFQRHLDLAAELGLPIVIHSRGAWKDCLSMTVASGIKRALFHWYSGPQEVLEKILKHGFYVSCSPSIGFSSQSRDAMTAAPIEQTLIETDSPVFYNQPEDAFQSEPRDVWRTLKAYALIKNIDPQIALQTLNDNARTFFKIA